MAAQSPKKIIPPTARTGYVCDQPGWPKDRQREILLRAGIPEARIWTEGHKGETLEKAAKAARSNPLEMAGGFRALGINPKQIMDKLPLIEGVTVMDAETGETNGAKLVTQALHAIRYGRNKIAEEDAERGRRNRAEKLKERRCPEAQAKAMWLDPQIPTNDEAARLINKGYEVPWTTQTLARWFGKSGRRIGRRPQGAVGQDYSGPGHIYFIKAGRSRVKIGHSLNHETRLASLASGNHQKLVLLGTVPGSQKDERAMHKQFAKQRVHGEWFKIAGTLATFLKRFETKASKPKGRK